MRLKIVTAAAAAAGLAVSGVYAASDAEAAEAGEAVRVNQVGYLPDGPKRATVVADQTDPLKWTLRDADGAEVAAGDTEVFGDDEPSGDHVHHVDFTDFTQPGDGYVLEVDGQASHPFDVRGDVYAELANDAWAFFYHQRAGIEIEAQYVGEAYARPAGHLGVAPNTGDLDVPCAVDCDYSLDVPHGWYDAGDQGKYVVNGGLSAWHLLNVYERSLHVDGADQFADGQWAIPENGNGVPDVLDEARWELEFLMEMQVPDGEPLEGMAHHKLHDADWTGFPTAPHDDPQQRGLRPPSTAATLNLAAEGAQCARLYAEIDDEFAARCRAAAEKAWQAALANPDVYAPGDDSTGGGAYSDDDVTDEFYWAAAELLLTTGDQRYLEHVTGSPHYGADAHDGYFWGGVAAMGDISMAYVRPSGADLAPVDERLVATADASAATVRDQGYPNAGGYHWGASSGTLAEQLFMVVAADLTDDPKYIELVVEQMDYLLGRNALDQSYVSQYGANPSENQHHRFWANDVDSAYPNPPAGALAGGPNPGLQDPIAEEQLADCPPTPQRCYIDNIHSYSTNEVAINWNAPLGWVVSIVAEQG